MSALPPGIAVRIAPAASVPLKADRQVSGGEQPDWKRPKSDIRPDHLQRYSRRSLTMVIDPRAGIPPV